MIGEQKARKYLWMRVPKLPPLDAHQQALHGQHRTVHRIRAPVLPAIGASASIGWSGGVAIWRRMTSSSVRADNKIGRRPIDSSRAAQQPLIQERASASKPPYERQQDESQRSNWGAH